MSALALAPLASARGTEAVGATVGLALVVALAGVHVVGYHLHVLDRVPRSRWLSFGSGVSVAYVFVHLLPELERAGAAIEATGSVVATSFERHVYLVALAGFALYYGVEQLVSRWRNDRAPFGVALSHAPVFWTHVGAFAVYDALVGYLLVERGTLAAAVLFAVAMALHLLVNDVGLREAHEERYDSAGRWLLAAATLCGGAVGVTVNVPTPLVGTVLAFVAGGVVLNAIKEELPTERESRFWAFGVGAGGYTSVLLLL